MRGVDLGTGIMTLASKVGIGLLSAGEDAVSNFDVATIMSDSVKTVQNQAFSVLGIVVPAIVLITGAVVGVKFGIGWLKRIRG